MPTTEKVTPTHPHVTDETIDTTMPTRDEATQEKLYDAEALLDEIDEVLDMEPVESTLTLSDLIRMGAKERPQVYGTLRNCKGTCALGAAEDGARKLGLMPGDDDE